MITLRHTTLGRTYLDEWQARRRNLYLTIHNTQETNIHASDGIRTHNPSKRAAADPRLWLGGHWDGCLREVVNFFSHLLIYKSNGPLYSCLSSLVTYFTCPCIQYPFLSVLVSRTPSYLIHQSFFRSSLTSYFLWFPFENFPWQSISCHSLYVSKLSYPFLVNYFRIQDNWFCDTFDCEDSSLLGYGVLLELYFTFFRRQASFDVVLNSCVSARHDAWYLCRLWCITFVRSTLSVWKTYTQTRNITLIIIIRSALCKKSFFRTVFYLPLCISNCVHIRRNFADPSGRAV
jgi:hypothetical protein